MGIVSKRSVLAGVKGAVGEFVIKHYRDKVVITAKPDMSRVLPTALQKKKRNKFAEAVKYAQSILKDRELKNKISCRLKPGETPYHYLIKEFLAGKGQCD